MDAEGAVRIGLYVRTGSDSSLDAVLERFERAEALGFHTAWVGQVFDVDALTLLALAGRVTRRIEIGSWVVPVQPRHPAALAQQALSVQAASGGRLVLGIGAGHRAAIERRFGLEYGGPAPMMREYLAVLRPLLAGENPRHQGPRLRASLRLRVAGATPPPVFLAALAPRMLRLAGEQCDGVAIWMGGPRYLESFAVPRLRDAARDADRPTPRVACAQLVALCGDEAGARAAAGALMEESARLPAYRRVLERGGVSHPSELAIVGDEGAIRRGLARLADLGVDDFNAVLLDVPGDPGARRRTAELLGSLARGSTREPASARHASSERSRSG